MRITRLPAALVLALALVPLARAQAPDAPVAKPDPILGQLVEAHNRERATEGLPPLKLESKLTDASLAHAKDMAGRKRMGHDGSDESTPEQRVARAGYHYLRTGENVAVGYHDVEHVMKGWMESPGHRKNIMGDFTEIGLARVVGEDDKPYWCADFGTPMPKLDPTEASKDLVQRINAARVEAKLGELKADEKLGKSAQLQAAALAKAKGQGVTASFDGVDQKAYADLAMTTASGHPDAAAMVKVILENQGLKDQVLGKYARIGTGYATAEDGVPFWCLILANPVRK